MKLLKLKLFIFFVLIISFSNGNALEIGTHRSLNELITIGSINGFSLDSYLRNNLGLSNGRGEILNNKELWQWVTDGGQYEDEPAYSRSFNHFHDPLQPWYIAGFDKTFKSSLIWAQDQGNIGSLFGGDWSWKKARNSYYQALTSLTKNGREMRFADTFRALGQIMHLIQDASVPAHVRNDTHVYIDLFGKKIGKYHYEMWVNDNIQKISLTSKGFDKAILNIIPEATAPISIANIFDTNKYNLDGSNPEVATGSSIGITEYTNANFFSEGTIFKQYPHPAMADTNFPNIDFKNPEVVDAEDGKLDNRIYIRKVSGEQVQRLASLSYVSYECIKKGYYQFSPLVLDDKVYEDYATKLIPRSVGYSAGLLEYFFRGNLQITAVPIFYKGELHFMRLKIKNLTPNEIMSNGDFTLIYRYTPPGGNADGSDDIFMQAWAVDGSPFVPCSELKPDKEMVVDFRIYPPLPKNDYVALKFVLAFRGTLGSEVGAIIGKSFDPGRIIFEEEWDKDLPGNYEWAHTEFNWNSSNPLNGLTVNTIEGDRLTKENIRYAGSQLARVNESFLGHEVDGHFKGPFPLSITPNTYVMYKIDEMSVNPPGVGYQIMLLSFTNKLALQISQDGQMVDWNPTTTYYTFTPGQLIVDNIYELFQRGGITIPSPFEIFFLGLDQHLDELEAPAAGEHTQRMKVDFIRIVEGNVQ